MALAMLAFGVTFFASLLPANGQTHAGAGPFRTQTLELQAGWNAIYLEVEPLRSDPSELFAGMPIEIAAAYFRPVTAMEFIESPDQVLPDRAGWSIWYASDRDDSVLSNLYRMQSHQAYLLYTEEACTLRVEGVPFHGSAQWHPNAFSLVGFPIDAGEQPTMANFFSGAKAHTPLVIYRLLDGRWMRVQNPAQTLMEPGKAYWVYSDGTSNFRGPLTVDFARSSAGGLIFTETTGVRRLEIANVSIFPQQLRIRIKAGATGTLPMAYVVQALNGEDKPIDAVSLPFPAELNLGPLDPGQSFALDLEVVQEEVTAAVASAAVILSTDAGLRLEIPVISVRRDLVDP